MKTPILSVALLAAMTIHASAQDCGPYGSPGVLKVTGWSVIPTGQSTKTEVEVANISGKGFRMVEGFVMFDDALGGNIDMVLIKRDLTLPADGTGSWSSNQIGSNLSRVPNLNSDDVEVYACVRQVLYDDGTKQFFSADEDHSLANEIQKIIGQ